MRIQASDIAFASHHSLFGHYEKEESLKAWVGPSRPNFENQRSVAVSGKPLEALIPTERILTRPDRVSLSDESLKKRIQATSIENQATKKSEDQEELKTYDAKTELMKIMVEMLTGRKIKVMNISEFDVEVQQTSQAIQQASVEQNATAQGVGWGVEYEYREVIHEKEMLDFEAKGTIVTTDGQTLEFDFDLEMSREFYAERNFQFAAGDGIKKDPLIFNFAGPASELSDFVFDFDLDLDGKMDELRMPGTGKGYLVFDKNKNGKVDDGSELFGPKTGNGFSELAQLDDDKNSWIDEGDGGFDRLKLWSYDFKLGFQMQSLSSQNVGALYTKALDTPFALRNSANQELGDVRATSVFVKEDGSIGSMQQIDLVTG